MGLRRLICFLLRGEDASRFTRPSGRRAARQSATSGRVVAVDFRRPKGFQFFNSTSASGTCLLGISGVRPPSFDPAAGSLAR